MLYGSRCHFCKNGDNIYFLEIITKHEKKKYGNIVDKMWAQHFPIYGVLGIKCDIMLLSRFTEMMNAINKMAKHF